ncbi:MAG TPA: DinB family protein [Actinophytocola sp.]|uniref:DinB family protein n=1 Tax=Actinophytocola sp. TaxID=1872138 RepID=UPI002DB6B30E|nr:DinB family protein [Actinophytocola sp.]HEU5474639.1 DinB family protein [Actinophytocola sp.]
MTLSTATPVQPLVGAHLVAALDVGFDLVLALTEGFDEATAFLAPDGHKPLVWFLGHLACAKDYFSTLHQGTPKAVTDRFSDNFADGADTDFEQVPPLAEMIAIFRAAHERIREFAAGLAAEDFARRTAMLPDENMGEYAEQFRTLGKALALTQMHDSFHAGQMVFLRRALGMESPV